MASLIHERVRYGEGTLFSDMATNPDRCPPIKGPWVNLRGYPSPALGFYMCKHSGKTYKNFHSRVGTQALVKVPLRGPLK